MERRILIGLVVILALLAAASVGLADSDSRPFKGSGAGTWWIANPIDPEGPEEQPEACDIYGLVGGVPFCEIEGEATVIVTHLGKGTLEFEHVSDWTGLPVCAPMVPGTTEFTFTAANGDELSGTYDGAICITEVGPPIQLGGVLTLTVTSGTGRFDPDATGQIIGTTAGPMTSDIGGEGTWSFEGRIGY